MIAGINLRQPKWMVAVALLVLCVTAGAWLLIRRGANATQYQTAVVARGELTQIVTATGQLNPVTNVQVGCQISGTIQKLFADFNSPVTNGQVVVQLDSATYRANVQLAEGDLANAKAGLELAKVNAARARELFDGKLIPQSDFDQATANLHQAEAMVMVKEAGAEKARVDLARCTIYSPVDGIVISRSVDVGQTVAASLNAPTLFVIANDLTKMQIDANVAEADVGGVDVDQDVEFTVDAFPTRTFHGQVIQVRNAPVTVQNVVTYDTVIAVNNRDLKLKPGMTANVSIVVAQRDDALKIPNAALRYRPPDVTSTNAGPARARSGGGTRPTGGGAGGWAGKKRERPARSVYVLGADSKPQSVQIKTGITDGIATEVLEGLKEGDKVITSATTKQSTSQQPQSPFAPGGMPRRF